MPHFPWRRVSGALLIAVAVTGCGQPDGSWATGSDDATELVCTSDDTPLGGIQAYFAPFDPVEHQVLCLLDTAQDEVIVGQYNPRRQSYLDKLVALQQRGVTVKVVVDEQNAARDYNVGDDFLEQAGIDLVRTRPSSRNIMHLKATVIDGAFTMTGSFNWNGTAALANDENMVVSHDPALADRYREQILEVRGDDPEDVYPAEVTPTSELLFSPESKLEDVIIGHIAEATSTIDVAMYTYTRQPITDALIEAMSRGVQVRVVFENKQLSWGDYDDQLEAAGATVVRGANTIGAYSAMHHKYAIIDGQKVITGATNWTKAGTSGNDEDLLVVRDADLAGAYARNFADLLSVYGGIEDTTAPTQPEAGLLLNAIHSGTSYGDRVVVTGNHPALGNWNPWHGVEMQTSESMFPSWTARAHLPAGTRLEYKFVWIDGGGNVRWEPGQNRVLEVPTTGRAVVRSGPFGDTATNWSPAD